MAGVATTGHPSNQAHGDESNAAGASSGVLERVDVPRLTAAARELLLSIGEDPSRDGLQKTPQRVAKAWEYFTEGYAVSLEEIVNGATFALCDDNEVVLVKDIRFSSMCEHHLLPFYGECHVAYIPNGRVIGLSKIVRIVEMFSKRLQVQERLCNQIAQAVNEAIAPQGVAVVVSGAHMCMACRGVRNTSASASSLSTLGKYKSDGQIRREFLDLVALKSPVRSAL